MGSTLIVASIHSFLFLIYSPDTRTVELTVFLIFELYHKYFPKISDSFFGFILCDSPIISEILVFYFGGSLMDEKVVLFANSVDKDVKLFLDLYKERPGR